MFSEQMESSATRRLKVITNHILDANDTGSIQKNIERSPCGGHDSANNKIQIKHTFDVKKLNHALDGFCFEERERVKNILKEPIFKYQYNLTKEEERNLNFQQVKRLAAEGLIGFDDLAGSPERRLKFYALLSDVLTMYEPRVSLAFGIQMNLFGASIYRLGNESHRRNYMKEIEKYNIIGGFCLTEVGHGTNARGVETTATYDSARGEFVITSPTPSASKLWPGNILARGNHCVVFANLITKNENHGLHAFIVPVRDSQGKVLAGVQLEDLGNKMGLNGLDNPRITFTNVRVPRANLLNKFGDVAQDGTYSSTLKHPGVRFLATIGVFSTGRIGIAAGAIAMSKVALTTAVKFGHFRRQFGPTENNEDEVPIISYLSHQRRLFPMLAGVYMWIATLQQIQMKVAKNDEMTRWENALASGIKARATWHGVQTIQACREACGGFGYLQSNRIARLRQEVDAYLTFEGDNTVLTQEPAKVLLMMYMKDTSIASTDDIKPPQNNVDLTSFAFRRDAFNFMKRKALELFVNKMNGKIAQGVDKFDAWTQSIDRIFTLTESTVDFELVTRFEEFCGSHQLSQDTTMREVMNKLATLYALWRMDQNAAWFMVNGYFTTDIVQALQDKINELCTELLPHSISLVDSFGVPNHFLGPIAFEDWVKNV